MLWREHDQLLRHGDFTVGCIYMANKALFERGLYDGPASMLHSFDPFILRNPDILQSIGSTLYERYASGYVMRPRGPWYREVHGANMDDHKRTFGLPLPPSLTWGHIVFLSTPMIHRRHLSAKKLVVNLVPVMAAREPRTTGATFLVPSNLYERETDVVQ